MNIRCRGPKGQFTLRGLAPEMSVAALQGSLEVQSGISSTRQDILKGFPPKPLQLPFRSSTSLTELGIENGDTLVIREKEPAPLAESLAEDDQPEIIDTSGAADLDEDEQLARALAASMQHTGIGATQMQQANASLNGLEAQAREPVPHPSSHMVSHGQESQSPSSSAGSFAPIVLHDGSAVLRRVIESDNSCLFNAVGYVMEASKSKAQLLRKVIAESVARDNKTYTEHFLGKSNREYQTWIQNSSSWGGAIELSILSRYYAREIAAYDIQTKRVDIYGEEERYTERAMILYDGLHYDALAQAAFDEAPEELDVTLFEISARSYPAIEKAASEFVAKAHDTRQFTNTSTFTLRCGICQIGVKGEKGAVKHANETGHQSFQEYH